jgi:hypothetical protein
MTTTTERAGLYEPTIPRCAANGCMKTPAIEMRFPADVTEQPIPYCTRHAVVVARAYGAEEAGSNRI